MGKVEQERLNLLFEYENLKCVIMDFSMTSNLKLIVSLGSKDKNGNKKRAFEEFRYESQKKYSNMDHLISASLKIKSYLSIDYIIDSGDGMVRKGQVYIPPSGVLGLRNRMEDFDSKLLQAFSRDKNGNLSLIKTKMFKGISYPSNNGMIEFEQDIFENENYREEGVRLGFNQEYYHTIPLSAWKSFMYYIESCNLIEWGLLLAQPYLNQLPGNAVSEYGNSNYSSSSKYTQYWDSNDDPDEVVNNISSSVGGNMSTRFQSKAERKASFFDQ